MFYFFSVWIQIFCLLVLYVLIPRSRDLQWTVYYPWRSFPALTCFLCIEMQGPSITLMVSSWNSALAFVSLQQTHLSKALGNPIIQVLWNTRHILFLVCLKLFQKYLPPFQQTLHFWYLQVKYLYHSPKHPQQTSAKGRITECYSLSECL